MPDINKLEGFRLEANAPSPVVAMATIGNRLFVATGHQVFELIGGILRPMVFAVPQEEFDSTAK